MINKIKIAGMEYTIVEKALNPGYQGIEDDYLLGQCQYPAATIEIDIDATESRKKQTIIHEMMHAVFFESGVVIDGEEKIVNQLGLTMYQVLKDNDFSWLKNEQQLIQDRHMVISPILETGKLYKNEWSNRIVNVHPSVYDIIHEFSELDVDSLTDDELNRAESAANNIGIDIRQEKRKRNIK
ncbi:MULTISPECIES: hypothetical protein [Aerococcus]|uniref:ImmA/IrrE family metallo-endopeptidase n=7 Tax=Lactobacillales TaxID=186826 RepID=A0A329P116_9LACT|nr:MULTISPECIES: hypothetical protein [Aerococcus]KAA9242177.1 hypothetical protein F6I34_01615 [Aerococcus urinae]KAA9298658.1 hypothetical protein F6I08_04770 [Aerococcus tenax]MCY3026212.1 hypothetical protein [Aerococcus loyolae]MCY3035175.1 hypothetical protein [Aerococcus mictus]MCY3064239.1 hypothetical protein [Aerococcus mictus]